MNKLDKIKIKVMKKNNFKEIRKILKNAGLSRKVRTNLINGVFTPVNFSKKRFDTKVNTIERELDKLTTEKRQFSLNEDFSLKIFFELGNCSTAAFSGLVGILFNFLFTCLIIIYFPKGYG